MKRTAYYLSCVLFALVIISCKLTILSFEAPDTADTGTAITLSITARADQTGDGAIVHGVVVQIPENWQVVSGKGYADAQLFYLSEDPVYESLYTPDIGYKVWVGTVSGSGPQNGTLSFSVRVMTDDFGGNPGETRSYTLKSAVGVLRENAWIADDPVSQFNFSNIAEFPYVRSISVTKAEDNAAPDPVTMLQIRDHCNGSITIDWTGYGEEAQGDVYAYRVYRSDSNFGDVSQMVPLAQFPAGSPPFASLPPWGTEKTFQIEGLNFGETYYFAVTAVDELLHETSQVISVAVTPTEGAKISGTIRDSNDNPITGTSIPVQVIAGDPCGVYQWITETSSNPSDGTYTVSRLPVGSYYLQTWNNDASYLNEWWSSAGSTAYCNGAEAISIQFDEIITGIDFQLDAGGMISGKVTQVDGETGSGNLWVFTVDYETNLWMGGVYTDPDGSYALDGLPAGNYRVMACPGCTGLPYVDTFYPGVYQHNEATPVSVAAGQPTSGIDFSLAIGASITGTLKDSSGNPVTGVSISVNVFAGDPCGEYQWVAGTSSNPLEGTYSVSRLLPGSYYLQTMNNGSNYLNEWWSSAGSASDCSSAEAISVQFGETIAGIDFSLVLGASITGTIKDSNGHPVTGPSVSINVIAGAPCGEHQWVAGIGSNPFDGTYTVSGLHAGSYYLQTWNNGTNYLNEWWSSAGSAPDCNSAEAIPVQLGETIAGIDFRLDPGSTISGRVTRMDGVTGIDNLYVFAMDYETGQGMGNANTGPDGSYAINGLPAGNYRVMTCAGCTGLPYVDELYDDVYLYDLAVSVAVTEGEYVSGIDFSLALAGTVSGTIRNRNGNPITDTSITVGVISGNPCGEYQWVWSSSSNPFDGTYSVSGFPAGSYYLRTWNNGANYLNEWWSSNGSTVECSGAQTIMIQAGETTEEKDFQLEVGGSRIKKPKK